MGQFALLPAELQVKIFGYLGNVDIKAARLVSRGFRDNAAPALFRSIILAPRIEILRISGGTFMHPVYSNYVKELVFDGTLYSSTITADIFFYERMERAWGREFTESDSTIISRFDDYELLYKEQETLLRTGFFKLALARCLEKAPISSIVYSPRQRTIPAETRHQKFLMPTGHPPHWPSGTEITGPEHHFRQLLAAIFETRYTGIRELIIETPCNRDWNTEFAIPIFTFPDSDDLRAGQHLFRNLVRLEMKLCLSSLAHEKGHPRYTESSGETATKQLENLAKVLESAQELKSMCLVLLHWKDSPQSMYGGVFPDGEPIFRRLGLGATWPKLRCLILYGIYAWKQDIIDLIDRHKDTLDDFRLSRCGLCDGTWADVADHIRSKPTPISEFSLGSVYEFNDAYAAYTAEERELWKYQFLLTRGPDGKLEFRDCDPDPNRKSVYDARRS